MDEAITVLRNAPYSPQQGFCRPTRIVAASVLKDGRVWAGKRHAELIPLVFADTGKRVNFDEQGFLTDTGHHCMRTAAMALVRRYKQIPDSQITIQPNILLSEDLWPEPK